MNVLSVERPKTKLTTEKTVVQLFEEQADLEPDKTAIVFGDKQLSYGALNNKANALAKQLRQEGVKPDCIVGVMLKRSLELVTAILAVIKADGAYLPIDPEYPKDRIDFMLRDSRTRILLTQSELQKDIPDYIEKINVDLNTMNGSSNLHHINKPEDLIYVIYTSGSTGRPKGVMLTNKSVANFITGVTKRIDFNKKTIISITTVSFDIFVLETLLPLTNGLKVVIASEAEQREPALLAKALRKNCVQMIQSTPSRFQLLLSDEKCADCLAGMTEIMIGGEPFPQNLLERLKKITDAKIYNMYGPTETTVWSTIKDLSASTDISIGTPICNTDIYIFDENLQPVELGQTGELIIGGAGVARGYLNRPELTKERFITNVPGMSGRTYRTGDLVKMRPDGEIEYIGRIDNQVKIRGYRIEFGEIESLLKRHKSVKDTVVVCKEDAHNNKYLCAYLVLAIELSLEELREYLLKELPDYMIPSRFIKIDGIPLTPNGKADRNRLLKMADSPNLIRQTGNFLPPANKSEETVKAIIEKVLERKDVSMGDSFIKLGGDSLKAAFVAVELCKAFHSSVSIADVLNSPSIKKLVKFEKTEDRIFNLPISRAEEAACYPASFDQIRIYVLNLLYKGSIFLNIPAVIDITGALDVKKLEFAFNALVERHESLRTYFKVGKSGLEQYITDKIKILLEVQNCDEKLIQSEREKFVRPFDLGVPPLFRAKLLKISDSQFELLFDCHHIIGDGTSFNIFFSELMAIYSGKTLEHIAIRYRDYAIWQKKLLVKSPEFKKQEDYWKSVLPNDMPEVQFPLDHKKTLDIHLTGKMTSFIINRELADRIQQIAADNQTTLNSMLFAIFSILLYMYTEQQDFVSMIYTAGRRNAGLEKVIGIFGGFIPVRVKINPEQTFRDFVYYISGNLYGTYENQEYGFERILKRLKLPLAKNILNCSLHAVMVSTLFIFHNEAETRQYITSSGVHFSMEELFDNGNNILDLTFHIYKTPTGEIKFYVQYNPFLIDAQSIENFNNHFIILSNFITQNFNSRISDTNLFSEKYSNVLSEKRKNARSLFNPLRFAINLNKILSIVKRYLSAFRLLK
jgi:amino acid adenylation domain-containing protein